MGRRGAAPPAHLRVRGRLEGAIPDVAIEATVADRTPWGGSDRRQRLPADWYKRVRPAVLRRDLGICQICGVLAATKKGGRWIGGVVDHIVPGDDHRLANLQTICSTCDRAKSSAEGVAARRPPRRRPSAKHPGLIQ
jgi:5-methylcytosine-specific restriction endonuclease McrA